MNCSPPGSSVHGIPQARCWNELPSPSPGELPLPRDQTQISCTAGRFFIIWANRKAMTLLEIWNSSGIMIHLLWRKFHKPQSQSGNFSSVQSLSRVRLFATPWVAACQASLSITNSRLLKLMPIESVMPSSHLIPCCPLLLLLPIPPSIRGFSSESTFRMGWPKYWSFSFSISPSNEHQDWSPSG